uniref:Uncharacterized protein n=1 Tax=Caulerpa lentillifera TaxID=148947 RepID=A0A2Z2QKK6_9CHLO|nr:hypothetical protein [Caulerpa lentillifera]AST24276.1 hypothetical protein [Caulerpa lentillifera]QKS32227.1 hypothetical protein [Caulerpa lentillifera]
MMVFKAHSQPLRTKGNRNVGASASAQQVSACWPFSAWCWVWGIFYWGEYATGPLRGPNCVVYAFRGKISPSQVRFNGKRQPLRGSVGTTSRVVFKKFKGLDLCRCTSRPLPKGGNDSIGCQRRFCSTKQRQTVFWGLSFYIYLTSFVNFYTLLHPIVSRLVLWCIILVIGLNVCDLLKLSTYLSTQGFSINSIFAGFWLTFSWPLKCALSVYPITLELVFVNYILLKSQRVKDHFIESYGVELLKKRGLNPSASLFRTVVAKMSQITAAAVGFHTVGKIVEGNYYWSRCAKRP